ncbi:MAG TPA: hypothetical protein VEV45_20760 [Streptosporangiaceae bacterium]|nr:hypothetical protein [Streptosporangiaceae bacterium]
MADVFRWEDRGKVRTGDTITWQPPGGRPLQTGTVEYGIDEAVYVQTGSGSFAMRHRVPWGAVVVHIALARCGHCDGRLDARPADGCPVPGSHVRAAVQAELDRRRNNEAS